MRKNLEKYFIKETFQIIDKFLSPLENESILVIGKQFLFFFMETIGLGKKLTSIPIILQKGAQSVRIDFYPNKTVSVRYFIQIGDSNCQIALIEHLLFRAVTTTYVRQEKISLEDFIKEIEVIREYLNLTASIFSAEGEDILRSKNLM